jgi:UDP:flavonoid glycosyltransferase YjiC (YdhE family)
MRGHVLCVTSGLSGPLYSTVELARRLGADGLRITFAGPDSVRALVEALGLEFLELAPSRYEAFLTEDARRGLFDRLTHLGDRREKAAAAMAVKGLAEAVRDTAPDLVLVDGEMHEHIIATWAAGRPMALLNTFASIWRRPSLPPPHRLARPGVGWTGTRAGMKLQWLDLHLRKRLRTVVRRAQRVGCDRVSLLHLMARNAGFDLARETDDSQWLIPFTYRNLPVLSLHAKEFDFPHTPARNVRYVGPMMLEARLDLAVSERDRAELDAIVERQAANPDRRLIYAGFGSEFTTDLGLLRRLAEAVARRDDWEMVISLGDQAAPVELGDLPPSVHAFRWVPQLKILRHADAAVVHGGINTIDECVLNGVPMLVYCGFETDMAGNTARVAYHGLGIAGDRKRDDAAAMGRHLDRLMTEALFEKNVDRMKTAYEAYAANRVAEQVVADLLARGPTA